jgi:hypothetical protein
MCLAVLATPGVSAAPLSDCQHGATGAASEDWVPPEGAVVWSVEEFRSWLVDQDEAIQLRGKRFLDILTDYERPVFLVFLRSDYEKWRSSIPQDKHHCIDSFTLRTQVARLHKPAADLLGERNARLGSSAQSNEDEVVVVATALVLCPACAKILELVIEYLLIKFVVDPFVDAMIANWGKTEHCKACWYDINSAETIVYEQCNYCSHGELGLIRDYGTCAKTYCLLCQGIVWIYNPLA